MSETSIGLLYAVLAALSFALWNIYLQRALERGAAPRAALLTLSASVAGAGLPLVVAQAAQGALPPLNPAGLAYFIGAGLMTAAVAPFYATQATRRIGAAQTTSVRLLDPMFAFAIALLFLGERIVAQAAGGVLLIVLALGLLQWDGRRNAAADRPHNFSGIAFAVGASLFFTIGSSMRKAGLVLLPAAPVSVLMEGLTGLAVVLPALAFSGRWREAAAAFRREHRDLWWSGLGGAAGTFFLNLALQRLAVPLAVAVRNTSPWFALILVPLILGSRHRPGRLTWASTVLLTAGMLLIVSR